MFGTRFLRVLGNRSNPAVARPSVCFHIVVNMKGSFPKPGMTQMELFNAQFKRKVLLLRGAMIRRRMFKVPFLRDAQVMSFSDVAGHSAFVCLAASYMATDISDLRITAISGITLSIIFQYYREKPLWIPIRWNFLFLITNAVLLYLLFKESNDADNLPEEQKLLFTQLFKDVGNMKMEDMLHLMMVANREEYHPGSKLISSGRRRHHVYLVLSGKCSVIARNGETLGTIGPNQFISEQSFITWQTKFAHAHAKRKAEKEALSNLIQLQKAGHPEIRDAEIGGEGNGSGIAGDPTDAHIPIVTNFFAWMFPSNAETTSASDTVVAAAVGVSDDVREEDRYLHLHDDAPRSEWLVGKADIVVEEPTVVYSWRFPVLHEMIQKRPSIGVVFERLISADLNRKMAANTSLAVIRSYKQMVVGALSEGTKVSAKTRSFLEKYRTERGITEAEHVGMVEALGWTIAEFERGRKGGEGKEFDQYLEMVKNYCLASDVITQHQKNELRKYRKANRIDRECHERYLLDCGWTMDEYEQCQRDSYVPPVEEPPAPPLPPAPAPVRRRPTPLLNWLGHMMGGLEDSSVPPVEEAPAPPVQPPAPPPATHQPTPLLDWLGYMVGSLTKPNPTFFLDTQASESVSASAPASTALVSDSAAPSGGESISSGAARSPSVDSDRVESSKREEKRRLEQENISFLSPSPKSVSFFLDPVPVPTGGSGSSTNSRDSPTTATGTATATGTGTGTAIATATADPTHPAANEQTEPAPTITDEK